MGDDWTPETATDRASVWLHAFLVAHWEGILIAFAGVVLLAEFAFTLYLFLAAPGIAMFSALSLAPAFVLVIYLWWRDAPTREPLRVMALTFVLGGVFASVAALLNGPSRLVEVVPVIGSALFFLLFVGPIEEVVKWLAVRIAALDTDSFDHVVDGAVYGAAAGLGFAAVENAVYISNEVLLATQANTSLATATMDTAFFRSLVGPGHVLYSAIAGLYLGVARFTPDFRGALIVKGLLIAAVLHAGYNSLVTYLPAFIDLPLATFLTVAIGYNAAVFLVLLRHIRRYR